MDHQPSKMQMQHVVSGHIVPERRRSFERKLSEYSGYALLILCVAMMISGLILVLR